MIRIDSSVCIGCGSCVKDCPSKNLHLEDGVCKVIQEECRLGCGHCVAICPVHAVTQDDADMTSVEKAEFRVDPADFLLHVKSRRSIRRFQERKLTHDEVEYILQAGRFTETAKNTQAVRYIFVQDQLDEFKALVWKGWKNYCNKLLEEGDRDGRRYMIYYNKWDRDHGDDRLFFNAPGILLVLAEHPLDGGLAAANIENMAVAMGLGVLFDGYIVRALRVCPEAMDWLDAKDLPVRAAMLLGYPAVSYPNTAPRKPLRLEWK